MTTRAVYVTADDLALLSAIARTGSVAAASRSLGISRDLGVYRLARLPRAAGGAVVASARGGAGRGGTRLTARGWGLLRRTAGSVRVPSLTENRRTPAANRLVGRWHSAPSPHLEVGPGLSLAVGFDASEGETVSVTIDPESILLARRRFATSARNVLSGTVRRVTAAGATAGRSALWLLSVGVGPVVLRALVTDRARRELALARNARVVLYVKATAVRPVGDESDPTPGSRRSSARRPPPPRGGSGSR